MRKIITAAASVALTAAVLGAGAGPAPAAETTPVTESQVDTAGTTGTVEFLNDGVYLRTVDWSQEARGLYDVHAPTADISTLAQDWQGSSEPGIRLEIDLGHTDEYGTPDGSIDGTLTLESVYGGNLWASASSSDVFKDLAPHTAPGNGNNDGQGSQWYGTWEEWRTSFTSQTEIARAGFLLGVPGRGTLLSQTVGDTTYTFGPDAPAPTAKVAVDAYHVQKAHQFVKRSRVHVLGTLPSEQHVQKGRNAPYKVVKYTRKGRAIVVARGRVGAWDKDVVRVAYPNAAKPGKRTVKVFSRGDRIYTYKMQVRVGPRGDLARKGWDLTRKG